MTTSASKHPIFKTPGQNKGTKVKFGLLSSGRADLLGTAETKWSSLQHLPGSEQDIDAGNALEEAQMKVVTFGCEIERLSALNYELVKENEVLTVQKESSERVKNLEFKLAILLAENEKLKNIIEGMYTSSKQNSMEKKSVSREEHEKKIEELQKDIEYWKKKYHELKEMKKENEQNKVEMENQRLVKVYQGDMNQLFEENENLRKTLQDLGDKLQNLVSSSEKEIEITGKSKEFEKARMACNPVLSEKDVNRMAENVKALLIENDKLNKAVEKQAVQIRNLEKGQQNHFELVSKYQVVSDENEKLKEVLRQKQLEIENCKKQVHQAHEENKDRQNKLVLISVENERLNLLLKERVEEMECNVNSIQVSQMLEIFKLHEQVENMTSEMNDSKKILYQKEQEYSSLQIRVKELEECAKGSDKFKEKLTLVSSENMRLLGEIDRLNDILKDKDSKMLEMLRKMKDYEDSVKILSEEKEALRKEHEEMKNTLGEEIEKVKLNNKNQIYEVSCLQEQMQNMILETKNMSLMLFGKEQECQSLKIKVNELEGCIKDQNELKEKLALITSENLRLLNAIDNLNAILKEKDSKMGEMENYEDLVRTTRAEKEELRKDFEDMKGMLGEEIERLNLQNKNQIYEISCLQEQWQNMILETKNMSLMLFGKEQECQLLKKQVDEMEECKKAMDELALISAENLKLVEEINKLSEAFKNSTHEMEEKMSGLLKEKEEKDNFLKVTQEEKEVLRSELESIKNQHLNTIDTFEYERQKSVQEVKKAQVREENVAKEILNCRERIRMSEEENEKLAAGHEKASNELKAIMRQNENLNKYVMELKKEVERFNVNDQSQITEISHLRTHIDNIRCESQKLSDILAKKNEECDVLIMRVKELEESTRILEELKGKLTLISSENLRLLGEIDHLTEMLKEKTMETEAKAFELEKEKEDSNLLMNIINEKDNRVNLLVNEVKDLQAKIQKLVEEKAQLKDILEQNGTELEDMKEKLRMEEHEICESKEKLEAIIEQKILENEKLKEDFRSITTERDQSSKVLVERTKEIERLNGKDQNQMAQIEDMKKYIRKLADMVSDKDLESKSLITKVNELEECEKCLIEQRGKLVLVSSENVRLLMEINNLKNKMKEMEVKMYEMVREKEDLLFNVINNKENQIKELNGEKDQLKDLVQKVKGEFEEVSGKLRSKIQEGAALKHKLEEAMKQIQEDRMRIEEMKKQMNNIGTNLEAARHENAALQNGLGDTIKNIRQLEEKIKGLENDKIRLEMMITEKNKEMERLKGEFDVHMNKKQMMFEEALGKEKKMGHEQREQLQKKIKEITEENARLVDNMNQIHNELVELRKKYAELEAVRNKEIAEFQVQLDRLNQMSQENIELQAKPDAEKKAYETLFAQYEMTLKEAEEEIAKLVTENENLTVLSCQRLKDYEQTRKKLIELEETYKIDISEMKNQIEQFKANHSDIKELTIKSNADRTADMIQINQLKQLNENYKVELQHLNEVLEQRRVDLENMNKENKELRKIQAYLSRIAEKEGQSIQEKFDLIQKELKHLENARNEFKESAQRNSIELQRKSKEMSAKIQELHNAKAKCEEAFENCQALGSQLFGKLTVHK